MYTNKCQVNGYWVTRRNLCIFERDKFRLSEAFKKAQGKLLFI